MQGDLSTAITRSRCVGGIDEHDFTASICSFACEVCSEQAPACIQNAFGQVVILDHVTNTEIFNRHMIVGGEQPMAQLVEEITALVGNPLMLPLQYDESLVPIGPPFCASGDTALSDTHRFWALRYQAGCATCSPSLVVMSEVSPTSIPTSTPVAGIGSGATSHAQTAYHCPALRVSRSVLTRLASDDASAQPDDQCQTL